MKIANHSEGDGVYLTFNNGFELSARWGVHSYCEHHEKVMNNFKKWIDWKPYQEGSHDVEIMITKVPKGGERLHSSIYKKFDGDGVIGYLPVEDWLWVVNRLNKWRSNDLSKESILTELEGRGNE